MVTRIQGEKVSHLFIGWDETLIWSCLQGVMGSLYADSQEEPRSAAAYLGDFAFYAGEPDRELLEWIPPQEEKTPLLLIPRSAAWAELIRETFQGRYLEARRYGFRKGKETFDREKLEEYVRSIPEGYRIVPIDRELFPVCLSGEWSADFVSQFRTPDRYEELGLGFVALWDGEPVSGASSYSRFRTGIEIETVTREDHRRKGLSTACAARLILECLDRGLYPSWDAANEQSARIAEKLGYQRGEEYTCFALLRTEEEQVKRDPPIKDLRFLIADIDGTLVNDPREMLPLTRRVLTDLHDRGVLLGIASGRPVGPSLLNAVHDQWGLDFDFDCVIGMNGGQMRDGIRGTDEAFYPLEPEVIREALDLLDKSGVKGNPFIYRGENMLARELDEVMLASGRRHQVRCLKAENDDELCEEPVAKLLWRLKNPREMAKLERYLRKHASEKYTFFKTQPNLMEIQDPRVGKALAMEAFCRRHGIPLDNVMAFGDMTNDNDMLLSAGWSVCLAQGSEDARGSADAVTSLDNNHDGFGHYLLEHWYAPRGWVLPETE